MLQQIQNLDACDEAIEWLSEYDNFEQAWNECERGNWLLWLVARLEIDHRRLTLAKARCAKLVVHLMEDERSIAAVEVAEQYGLGNASLEELNDAYANTVNTVAAYTAYNNVNVIVNAAATYAVVNAVAVYEKFLTLQQCANICRDVFNYNEVEQHLVNKGVNNGNN